MYILLALWINVGVYLFPAGGVLLAELVFFPSFPTLILLHLLPFPFNLSFLRLNPLILVSYSFPLTPLPLFSFPSSFLPPSLSTPILPYSLFYFHPVCLHSALK